MTYTLFYKHKNNFKWKKIEAVEFHSWMNTETKEYAKDPNGNSFEVGIRKPTMNLFIKTSEGAFELSSQGLSIRLGKDWSDLVKKSEEERLKKIQEQ